MRLHLELERDRLIDAGVAPEAAGRAARRRLGNPALIREDTRAVWGWRWLDGLGRDLRHVARGLRRSPGFTAVVVAVLGLGIGASTAVFSLVHGVLLLPLPFREPGRLVTVQIHIREMEDRFPAFPANLRAIEAWAACRGACAGVAAARPSRSTLTNAGEPRSLNSAQVTANFSSTCSAWRRPAGGGSGPATPPSAGPASRFSLTICGRGRSAATPASWGGSSRWTTSGSR